MIDFKKYIDKLVEEGYINPEINNYKNIDLSLDHYVYSKFNNYFNNIELLNIDKERN